MDKTFISIVMPVYNEERYINNCIDSLLMQDYPQESMEWIFVDGVSTDRTRDLIREYIERYPALIRLLNNPQKTVPYAMNIGIRESKGKYIIRLDAHADYSIDYISKCVYYLDTTDADNVGGVAETKSKGLVGNAIAKMLSSRFGVGNSGFRTNGNSGYVDTVPFGAFRRDVFEKLGGYDERLTRNQDNEMNYRIRKNGGKVFLSSDIKLSYYCRDSIRGISNMAIKNGMWNVITMKMCPGSMGVRHFIPLAFLISVILLPIVGVFWPSMLWTFVAEMAVYFALDCFFSAKQANGGKEFLLLLLLFPIFHITYGFGSVKGLMKLFSNEYR